MLIRLLTYFILVLALLALLNLFWEKLLTPPQDLSKLPNTPLETEPSPVEVNPTMARLQSREAWQYLNELRQSLQMTPLSWNPTLSTAAQAHADYSTANNLQSHAEQAGLAAFSGERPQQRAWGAGYLGPVSEVIAYNRTRPRAYVDDLMSAIYHRLSLLDMTQTEIGFGVAGNQTGKVKSVMSALLGNANIRQACEHPGATQNGQVYYRDMCKPAQPLLKQQVQSARMQVAKANPKLITWPKSGSIVPPVFYEEAPDPLPNCNVSGYPVHLQVNPIYQGRIEFLPDTFTVSQLHGTHKTVLAAESILTNLSDPHRSSGETDNKHRWIAFFPKHRLAWNGRFQAEVQYRENQHIKTRRWNFFTPHQPNLTPISTSHVELNISPGQTLTLYFPPRQCQVQPEAGFQAKLPPLVKLYSHFIDGETIRMTLNAAPIGSEFLLNYTSTHTQVRFNVVEQPHPQNALE